MSRPANPIVPEAKYRMQTIRKHHKLTQEEFADTVGISKSLVTSVETGKKPLTKERAKQIASVFPEYSIDWIMGLSDYENEFDERNAEGAEKIRRHNAKINAIHEMLVKLGYRFENPKNSSEYITIFDREGFEMVTCSRHQLHTLQYSIFQSVEHQIETFMDVIRDEVL